MPFSLQQLSDLEDIRTLKHRYYRGIDTADLALLTPLFTDDVTVEYRGGSYHVRVSGKAEMLEFLMNNFHADSLAMHHGHMPDITLVSADEATGLWYLEDVYISLERRDITSGSAIYRDHYRRVDDQWRIARTEYDRVMDLVEPLRDDMKITEHLLSRTGRQRHERGDSSHLIDWITPPS